MAGAAASFRRILKTDQPGQLWILHHVPSDVILPAAVAGFAGDVGNILIAIRRVAGLALGVPLLLCGKGRTSARVLGLFPDRVCLRMAALAALRTQKVCCRKGAGPQKAHRQHNWRGSHA